MKTGKWVMLMGYLIKRYVNNHLVTGQELSTYMITDKIIKDTITSAVVKNNERYHKNTG